MTSGDPSLKWDCEECQAEGWDRDVRNCSWLELSEEETNKNIAWDFDASLKSCPKSVVDHVSMTYLEWWMEHRRLGILPWPGDLNDQPAHVVEAFGIASQVQAERDAEKQAQQERAVEEISRRKGGR